MKKSLPFPFFCSVPFHMADPAGILFFGNAFSLFHQAFEHFVTECLEIPWNTWFQNPEWIVPIRHAEAEYLKPLLAGEMCKISLSLTAVSSSSFTIAASFEQKELCCSMKVVHVFCSRATKNKISIPEEFSFFKENR